MPKHSDKALLRALAVNQRASAEIERALDQTHDAARDTLAQADAVLARYGLAEPPTAPPPRSPSQAPAVPAWDAMVAQAHAELGDAPVSFRDVLTSDDLAEVVRDHGAFVTEQTRAQRLDALDMAAVACCGLLSGVVDVLYVGAPSAAVGRALAGALGAPSHHSTKSPKVGFDAVLGRAFGAEGNHRWNSASHHASFGGLISAVRDVLNATSTHVVQGVTVTVQATAKAATTTHNDLASLHALHKVLAATRVVLAHWWSDVNTPLGLPGPWMLFAKFIRLGSFEAHGKRYDLAQIAHWLYRNGLDLRRFGADGLTVTLNEALVRLWFLARRLHDARAWGDAAIHPARLRKALLCAHGVTAAVNAGKVKLQANPLGLNLTQWSAFLGRLGQHLACVAFDDDTERAHLDRWSQTMRGIGSDLAGLSEDIEAMPRLALGQTHSTYHPS